MLAAIALLSPHAAACAETRAPLPTGRCQRISFEGSVEAGQVFRRLIGGGLEVMLRPETSRFSGWEVEIVPAVSEGTYPDYAALATPPYRSVNPLLINTAYGMRAQDAVAWNPRSFQWIATPAQYRGAAAAYFSYLDPQGSHATMGSSEAMAMLVRLPSESSTGELKIMDARLAPGHADQTRQAAGVTPATVRAAHTLEPLGTGESPQTGGLHWLRFEVTLWAPASWKVPHGLPGDKSQCAH
jgi:hypothetical protein